MSSRSLLSDSVRDAAQVKRLGLGAGFARVGVAPARLAPPARRLSEWLARGYHAGMRWMERSRDLRLDPTALLPECRSIIALSLPYDTPFPLSIDVASQPERAWISRYAWGDDYHHVVRGKLRLLEEALRETFGDDLRCVSHVDSGPVAERVVAARAGLGWIGKNTCLIDGPRGSFHFLAVILTDLPLAVDDATAPRCGRCTACLDACPTGALGAPGWLDARRCLSYLTIEHRGDLPDALIEALGHNLFGCDICQDVCPWNRLARRKMDPAASNPRSPFAPREGLFWPRVELLEALRRGEFRRRFRNSPLRRRGLGGLRATLAAMRGRDGRKEAGS